MKADKIHIQRIGSSLKEENTIKDSCPFWKVGETNKDWPQKQVSIFQTSTCSLKGIDCEYGLTEIMVPEGCPLREGGMVTLVSLKRK